MYAVIRTGGKQYQVSAGETVRVEKLRGEIGDTIELADVLMVVNGEDVKIGQPVVAGAKVIAKISAQGKAEKVIVMKKKKRKGYKVTRGHRQFFTALTIENITA